jgi:small-conductance mechanosensitive channel
MSDYDEDRESVDVDFDDDVMDKRAHHNALERRPRDQKDSFVCHFCLEQDKDISELKLEIHRHKEKIYKLDKDCQTCSQEILELREELSKLSNELTTKPEGGNKQAVHEVSLPLQTSTDSKVHTQQLLTVAKKVAGDWEQLASWLSAEYFTVTKMREIREDHSTSSAFIRARAVLEMWITEFGRNATCQQLIHALCQMDQRATAVEVFGCRLVDSLHPL